MPGNERWTVLDLCSGLGGFSSDFEDSEHWRVVQVDIEERFDPDIRADVLELRPDDLPDADLVLASPPCKCFSRAAAWADHFDSDGTPQTPEARESVTLVYHVLGLIEAISPRYWFVENPMGSKIKQYLGEPTGRVTYCQYGTTYQKPTYLWGDHPPMTYRWCASGDHCHEHGSLEDERDKRPLPRDPAERAKVPRELSESIREAVEDAIENPPPEQQTLATDGGKEQSGLYEKYEVRKDGEVVEDCFVLEPETDEAAQAALATYALETGDEDLFEDLDAWLQELEFTDEAVVLAMGWTEQIAHFLEMYFFETKEDAYSPTSYQSAYLARELRERAGLESKDMLDDEPDAPPAYWDEDGGESDAE